MGYNHAERRVLTLLLLAIVLLWILFGFFWSILLVFTFLVLAFTLHRDTQQTRDFVNETVSQEKEEFRSEIADVPFTDVLKTQRPGFTMKSPAPLLSEVTRTLNFNVSRVISPSERFLKRGQLSKARRRFGNSDHVLLSQRQNSVISPNPIQGNASFIQPRSPSYFSVLNQPATVKIATADFVSRSFLNNIENTRSPWQERRQSPCSRETVLSALRGVRKRNVLDEDEDADDYVMIRKRSRYSKRGNDEPVAISASRSGNQNGIKRAMPTKTQDDDGDENEDNARKKMREDAKEKQREETSDKRDITRKKRTINSPLSEQLKRVPVQHSTPLIDDERSKRKKIVHVDVTKAEAQLRSQPITDGDIIMGEICEDEAEGMKAAKAEKKSISTDLKKPGKLPEAKEAESAQKEDKPKPDESHKKQHSSVKKDDPRRRSVPVYCASSDGIDLPTRRPAANRVNQEHFKHDRKAAWERVKWLLDDDEDDEDEGATKAPHSALQSQNAAPSTSSIVSPPALSLGSAASSVVQRAPDLVTLLTTSTPANPTQKSVGQVAVSTSSVTHGLTMGGMSSTISVSSTTNTALTALTIGTAAGQSLAVTVSKAVTTTTQSILAPVTSVPIANIAAASQGNLGITAASTVQQPLLNAPSSFAFGAKQSPLASAASVATTTSSGGSNPSSCLASSVVQGGFSFTPTASSGVNITTQPTTILGQAAPAASTQGFLGLSGSSTSNVLAKSAANQTSLGASIMTTQSGLGFKINPIQSAQNVFGSTPAPPVSSSTIAQNAFASVSNTSQGAFGSPFNPTQKAPGASSTRNSLGASGTQGTFGSGSNTTQNALGASGTQGTFGSGSNATQNTLGASGTQGTFGSGSNTTQNTLGASGTQRTFGSGSNATQNTLGASSTQGTFGSGSNTTQNALGASGTQGAFGSGSNTTQNALGASGTQGAFASNTTHNAFGAGSNTQSPFASASTQNAFGSVSKTAFGSAVTPATNTFGSSTQNAFGTNSPKPSFTQNAFGASQTPQGTFGGGSTNQSTLTFNGSSGNQASQNTFGSSQPANTGLAGNQTTGAAFKFGAQTPGALGSMGNQGAANSSFQFGANTQGSFGAATSAGNQTATNSPFQFGAKAQGGFAPSAGGQPTTNSPFKFGAQTQGGFASTQPPTQNAFGSGTSQNAAGASAGFNFGAGAQQPSGGFSFAPNSSTSGGFNFGSGSRPGTPVPSGGFNFGASSSPFAPSASTNPGNATAQRQRARLTARRRGKK